MIRRHLFAAALAMLTIPAFAGAQETAPDGALEPATAVFAGGCFWCTEADFEKLPGVLDAVSGYAGGAVDNPTYRQVTGGRTGHAEVVQVTYDPSEVSYADLVEYFWRTIDPTDPNGQFCDKGSSYRSAIFVANDEERAIVERSRDALLASGRFDRIVTEIAAAATFWPAEEYHQDYYKRNAAHYGFYRLGCGRDRRLRRLWGEEAGGAAWLQAG